VEDSVLHFCFFYIGFICLALRNAYCNETSICETEDVLNSLAVYKVLI